MREGDPVTGIVFFPAPSGIRMSMTVDDFARVAERTGRYDADAARLVDFVGEEVVGQSGALDALGKFLAAQPGGSGARPRALVVVQGDSGVGKTLTTFRLGEALTSSPEHMVVISGRAGESTKPVLFGSGPRYVGNEPSIVSALDGQRSIIMLDEIDKLEPGALDGIGRGLVTRVDANQHPARLGQTILIGEARADGAAQAQVLADATEQPVAFIKMRKLDESALREIVDRRTPNLPVEEREWLYSIAAKESQGGHLNGRAIDFALRDVRLQRVGL